MGPPWSVSRPCQSNLQESPRFASSACSTCHSSVHLNTQCLVVGPGTALRWVHTLPCVMTSASGASGTGLPHLASFENWRWKKGNREKLPPLPASSFIMSIMIIVIVISICARTRPAPVQCRKDHKHKKTNCQGCQEKPCSSTGPGHLSVSGMSSRRIRSKMNERSDCSFQSKRSNVSPSSGVSGPLGRRSSLSGRRSCSFRDRYEEVWPAPAGPAVESWTKDTGTTAMGTVDVSGLELFF